MFIILSIICSAMLFDLAMACASAAEHRHAWQGFKVCRNGAVYNIAAKRFATKDERKKLFAITDFI